MKASEKRLLRRQMAMIEKKEKKYLSYRADSKMNVDVFSGIRKKIPEKALTALETAFEKGFFFIFEKGTGLIEKTGNFDQIKAQLALNRYELQMGINKDTLRNFDVAAGNKSIGNKSISTVEGAALGVFGIGLPDIPVFLGVIFKSIYEIAISYGFDYDSDAERAYILSIIKIAASKEAGKIIASHECDLLGEKIDCGEIPEDVLTEEDIRNTSNMLATSLLVAKFIQGITIIGSIGAVFNYSWVSKISKIAKIKYKKRFLAGLLRNS